MWTSRLESFAILGSDKVGIGGGVPRVAFESTNLQQVPAYGHKWVPLLVAFEGEYTVYRVYIVVAYDLMLHMKGYSLWCRCRGLRQQ